MPRISFSHPLIDKWYAETEDGTSTFDICNDCFDSMEEAQDFDEGSPGGYNGDPIPDDAKIEDTLTPHPDIDDANYYCENCKTRLTSLNYY
jgi:hypothetical protein